MQCWLKIKDILILYVICIVTDQMNIFPIYLNHVRFAGYCVILSLVTNADTNLVFWQK